MKQKIMKFKDGEQEVVEGMEVFYVFPWARSGYIGVIEKVGRKFITLTNGRQFYLHSGLEKTNYRGSVVYSCKEAYGAVRERNKFIEKIKNKMTASHQISYDQAVRINLILKETENED